MGLLGSLLGGAIKVVITPVAIVSDVITVASGNKPKATETVVKSIAGDVDDIVKSL